MFWRYVAARAPVVTFETFKLLRVFPEPTNHPAVAAPVTSSEVKVPTDVIFVWLFWRYVAANAPIATFDAFRLLRVFPEPTNHPAATPFVTAREVRVPTDVIFVWVFWRYVAANAPIAMLDAFRLLSVFPEPTNHPAVTSPVTDRLVRVPTDVILVWLFWRYVAARAPVATFEAFRLLRMFPVTRPTTLAKVIFEIVLPWMSSEFMIPDERFEAFRLLRIFPVTRPTTLAKVILEIVLPWMRSEFMIPEERFEAFRLLRMFPVTRPTTLANEILEIVLP